MVLAADRPADNAVMAGRNTAFSAWVETKYF